MGDIGQKTRLGAVGLLGPVARLRQIGGLLLQCLIALGQRAIGLAQLLVALNHAPALPGNQQNRQAQRAHPGDALVRQVDAHLYGKRFGVVQVPVHRLYLEDIVADGQILVFHPIFPCPAPLCLVPFHSVCIGHLFRAGLEAYSSELEVHERQ